MSDRFTELLSGYLDHDLPRSEHDAVQRHLDSCVECRDTIAAIASVKTRAASLVDPPVPTDLWAGIASRIGPAGSSSAANGRARPAARVAGLVDGAVACRGSDVRRGGRGGAVARARSAVAATAT